MHEEEKSVWNVKKIAVGVIFLGMLAFFGYQNKDFLVGDEAKSGGALQQVAGVKTSPKRQEAGEQVSLPRFNLQEKVNDITQSVATLDVKEVASSSPQIQKVLRDIEALKNLPRSQAKDACVQICNGL